MSNFLDIKRVAVRVTENGHVLYRLNDFHEAAIKAGFANRNNAPGEWARKSGDEFLKSYADTANGRNAFVVVQGGSGEQGSYGDETVVYRYAAYLSVKFEVQVYQAFTEMKRGGKIVRDQEWVESKTELNSINVRTRAKITEKGGGKQNVHIEVQRQFGKAATGMYPSDLRKARNVPVGKSARLYWHKDEIANGMVIEMTHNKNLDQLEGPEEIQDDIKRVCTLFEGFRKAALLK